MEHFSKSLSYLNRYFKPKTKQENVHQRYRIESDNPWKNEMKDTKTIEIILIGRIYINEYY